MSEFDEEAIKIKAHQIWEQEGQPHGRDAEHWEMALQQLRTDREQGQDPSTTPGEVTASSVTAEAPPEPIPAGRAVDDEDPDYSPMDSTRPQGGIETASEKLKREVDEEIDLPPKGSA